MDKTKLKQIFNVPNILTYVRFLIIPFIMWTYIGLKNYVLAAVLVALSFATDVADGYIARHYNCVTDLGKIIDPIADKLTQISVIFCLSYKYSLILTLLAIMLVKEISIGIITLIAIKRTGKVQCAKWYGKLATGVFYISTLIILLSEHISETVADAMILTCCATVAFSLVMYAINFYRILKEDSSARKKNISAEQIGKNTKTTA